MENTIQRQLRGVRLKVGFNIGHKRQAFVFTDKAVIRRNRTDLFERIINDGFNGRHEVR